MKKVVMIIFLFILPISLFSVESGDPVHTYFASKIGYGPDTGGLGLDLEWKINFASFRLGAGYYNGKASGSIGARAYWNATKNVAGFIGINYGAVSNYGLYDNSYMPYATFGVISVMGGFFAEISVGITYVDGAIKELYQSSLGWAWY